MGRNLYIMQQNTTQLTLVFLITLLDRDIPAKISRLGKEVQRLVFTSASSYSYYKIKTKTKE